jgi:hypothetical protein
LRDPNPVLELHEVVEIAAVLPYLDAGHRLT